MKMEMVREEIQAESGVRLYDFLDDTTDIPDPIVVAFCGAKFHGKDTAAAVLMNEYSFRRVSFADGLRKTVATALRVNESYFTDPLRKEEIDPRTGKPRRYWLQFIGTEGFRALWDEIWVSWWKEEILSKGYSRVVTPDLRFETEFKWLKTFKNSMLIRIVNPNIPPSGDTHKSEALHAELPADVVIYNDGTIEDLHQKVAQEVERKFGRLLWNNSNLY